MTHSTSASREPTTTTDRSTPGSAQAAFDGAVNEVLRREAANRERQLQGFLAAWLADRQATIAAALEALPAGMAPATQAANVHAALLAEAGQPPAALRTQWAVQMPGHPFGLRIAGGETEAREALADQRAEHRPSDGPAPELVRRLVGDWQPVDGAQ